MRKRALSLVSGVAIVISGVTHGVTAAERPVPRTQLNVGAPVVAIERKHSRLSFELRELARLHRSSGSAAAHAFAVEQGISLSGATVQVVIQARPDDVVAVKSQVQALGGIFEMAASDLILARIPVSELESLASAKAVNIVRRPRPPTPFQTTSEGVNVIGAVSWHGAGRKGAGVKIAILDVGFDGYEYLMGSDLPHIPETHVRSFSGDITGGGEAHGVGVAEVAYDVAPEADLYLVNFSNEVELENAVQWLIEQRVDVINASWGFPCGGPLDGTGRTNAVVKRAAEAGILWVSAAGNFAQRHWSSTFNDTNGDGWHNFSSNEEGNTVFMNSGDELRVCVEWDDWTSKDQDFELYVWDADGYVVGSSIEDQSGPDTHDPWELLTFTANGTGNYHIGVKKYRGTRNPKLQLLAYPPGAECAIEAVAGNESSPKGLLGELRQFRDVVLAPLPFGRVLIKSYYRHSPEVRRILLLHPRLAIEAAALLNASRPAVRSVVGIRSGQSSTRHVLSPEYATRVDRFLEQLITLASPGLRDDLDEFRARATLSAAAGQAADQYWDWLLSRGPLDLGVVGQTYPDAGYMRYATVETSLVPPADSPHALTVGAIRWSTGALEEFSSRGPTADGRLKPDISGPDGVCTVTYGDCGADGFLGTSAAAPHVAGAAALVRQAYPLRSLTEIRNFLTGRAVDLAPTGPDNQTGAGRLALGSTSDVDVLQAPTVLAPPGSGAPIWPTFRWSDVKGAVSYRLMVAASAAALPTDSASQSCSGCLINTTTSTTYFTPSVPLLAAASYYWQVQGRAAGNNGSWTRASFTTTIWPELMPSERTDLFEESGPWPAPASKAVVITHGWLANTVANPEKEQPWVKEMADMVCGKLVAGSIVSSVGANALTKICQSNGWDVWVVDWSSRANVLSAPIPWVAFANAKTIGEMVASNFKAKNYAHVHFIAHSAGSNLINSATIRLKEWRPNLEIHDTFLDAFEPSSDASLYGAKADWTDNYVDTRDVFDLHLGIDGTKLFLKNGYNIEVTTGGEDPCNAFAPRAAECRHSRPYRFYGRSVNASFVGDADHAVFDPIAANGGMGYLLSTENGKLLSSVSDDYKNGEGCRMIGSSCFPAAPAEDQRFNIVRVITRTVSSVAGAVTWVANAGTSLLFGSLKLGVVSLLSNSPAVNSIAPSAGPTESPSLIVADVTIGQPVDKLRFNWRFGVGGQGFLRVFVDGMLVREIDQRHVPAASTEAEEIYIGGAAGTLSPGTHRIAFRIDGFGSSASGVELTDVELGLTSPAMGRRRTVRH